MAVKCPRCGCWDERLLSLSRTDNKTMICDECGTEEALSEHYDSELAPQTEWKGEG